MRLLVAIVMSVVVVGCVASDATEMVTVTSEVRSSPDGSKETADALQSRTLAVLQAVAGGPVTQNCGPANPDPGTWYCCGDWGTLCCCQVGLPNCQCTPPGGGGGGGGPTQTP